MVYRGRNGQNYKTIEPALGRGGEGIVYRVERWPDYVIKVLNENHRTKSRHDKILTMICSPVSDNAKAFITWPIDIVYDDCGKFVGYIMSRVDNYEPLGRIIDAYDHSDVNYPQKLTIAKNLCVVLNAVHNAGHVCGDLNPYNIGVDSQSGRVSIMDVDSFHIVDRKNQIVYRCEVGVPEFMPWEVQVKTKRGLSLATAPLPTYTKYSDLFALAVHIFTLLMNGAHPFACVIDSAKCISTKCPNPCDNIMDGFFPYAIRRLGYKNVAYAPEFEILPIEIQKLFLRAFSRNDIENRPDTIEWYHALENMQSNLKTCVADKTHFYPNHLNYCPWCRLEEKHHTVTLDSRGLCVFIVDTSSSMSGEPIKRVNEAIMEIKKAYFDGDARNKVDAAIIEFNEGAKVTQGFIPLNMLNYDGECSLSNAASMGEAVNLAVEYLGDRKRNNSFEMILNHKPLVFLFSSGKATDDISAAKQCINEMQRNRRIIFWDIDATNNDAFGKIGSDVRFCANLDEMYYSGIFESTRISYS